MQGYLDKRSALISGAIRAVAKDGLENTTTRSIGKETNVNDAYIYRFYNDKEDLLRTAFLEKSRKVLEVLMLTIQDSLQNNEELLFAGFQRAWEYLTQNPDTFRFGVFYYHSSGFNRYAAEEYRDYIRAVIYRLRKHMSICAESEAIIQHLIDTLFIFAVKVADGILPNDQSTVDIVSNQLRGFFQAESEPDSVSKFEPNTHFMPKAAY